MKADANTLIAAASLAVSLWSLVISLYFWTRRSLRPIVTVAVKTHPSDRDEGEIFYDLVVLNSGTIPAKTIRIEVYEIDLIRAFGRGHTEEWEQRFCSGFGKIIPILQNGDRVSGSFDFTNGEDTGFWKADAPLRICIRYKGWFGHNYKEKQTIYITDSETFTGYYWGRMQP